MNNLRTDVRTSTYRGCVAEHFGSLFDCSDDSLVDPGSACRHRQVLSVTRKSASTHQRPGPGAKVFRAKTIAHYFLDVLVDVTSRYGNHLPVSIFELEDIEARKLQRRANHACRLSITKLPLLPHA